MKVVSDEVHVHEFADATCTKPATCECGETQGTALGHNIENAACTGCGAKVVTLTEAAALEDGTLVFVEVTVSEITYSWSDTNKNMSANVTDGTTTLLVYKLATKVGAGDVVVIYGKIDSYNGTKQIAAGATAEIKTAHTEHTYNEGACTVCGAADPNYSTGETKTYTQVTSADQFTSGTYIIALADGTALSCVDGTWVLSESVTANGGVVSSGSEWTVVVNGNSVTLKDKNGTFIAPKGGNNNGLATTEYQWSWTWNEDGSVTFAGTGNDTVYLAYNTEYVKFRGYKTSTCTGDNAASYPCTFVIYKLA